MIVLDNLRLEYSIRDRDAVGSNGLHVEYSHDSISRDLFRAILDQMLFSTEIAWPKNTAPAQLKTDIPATAPATDQGKPGPAADQTPQAPGIGPGAAPGEKPRTKKTAPVDMPPGTKVRYKVISNKGPTDEAGTVVKQKGAKILVEFGPDDGRWVFKRSCTIVTPDGGMHDTAAPN
jgi:hypothetical protein